MNIRLFSFLVGLWCCSSQTINIPGDADTIQEAFGMINGGGLIQIAEGTLNGTGNCQVDIDSSRGSPILITGPPRNEGIVIIDCVGMTYGIHVLEHQGDNPLDFNLGDVTIQNTNGPAFILTAPKTEVDIRGVTFVNNRATTNDGISGGRGAAIHIAAEGAGTILDVTGANFTGNTAEVAGGAVYVSGGQSADIWGALVFNENSAPEGDDIFCDSSENLIIEAEQLSGEAEDSLACGSECNLGVTNIGAVCGNPSFPGDDSDGGAANIINVSFSLFLSFVALVMVV